MEYSLENMLGTIYQEILSLEEECPGVYYLSARKNELDLLPHEYYIVNKSAQAISARAKEYGQSIEGIPGFLFFSIDDLKSGQKIVAYEILRYRVRAHIPIDPAESLYEFSLYAAEYHPEYFGAYPAPLLTPCGRTVRYQTIENGICWLETDRGEDMVAFCLPLWELLSTYTRNRGKLVQSEAEDKTYLFFTRTDSCLPFFELWVEHPEWTDSPTLDFPALMNAIWTYFPDYAIDNNLREQYGAGGLRAMLPDLELPDAEPEIRLENMIPITPEVGTDFLRI